MQPSRKIQFNQAYYVVSREGKPVDPVAIRPEMYNGSITWMDTNRGKVLEGAKIDNLDTIRQSQNPPDTIEISAKNGDHYTLKKLTLQLYNNEVREQVANPPEFRTTEEVQTYYTSADFEPY